MLRRDPLQGFPGPHPQVLPVADPPFRAGQEIRRAFPDPQVPVLFIQDAHGHFARQDSDAWGLPETHGNMALGPDDLYLNEGGKDFKRVQGRVFGAVGRDTYKGMNASIADVDRNGWWDVYVSNVHHDFQAEGSLLFMTAPPEAGEDPFMPTPRHGVESPLRQSRQHRLASVRRRRVPCGFDRGR